MKYHKKTKRYSLRSKLILYNIATILILLLITGIILVIPTINILSNYIANDIEFFLIETNNNLRNKTLLIEDTLLSIRGNDMLVSYLESVKNDHPVYYNYEDINEQFKKLVNIYSDKNTDKLSIPFLQKVYLFAPDGVVYKSMYYQPLPNIEKELNKKYNDIYNEFMDHNDDVQIYLDKENVNLVYTLYSQYMQDIGTLIFAISRQALNEIMHNVDNYENAFWFMFDKSDNIILDKNTSHFSSDDYLDIVNTHSRNTYRKVIADTDYLLYTERMNMNFNCTIGIPNNQLSLLLYESINLYIFLLAGITILLIIVTALIISKMTRPLKDVADSIQLVGEGKFDTKLPNFPDREFSDISRVFNNMTDEINYLVNEVYEKQLAIKESELKFLQSQMDPHFMFNVLNTIAIKAKLDNNEDIYKMVSSFAGLTQASIYRSDTEKIRIKEELKLIDFYLYLQSYRFGDKLSYTINCQDEKLLELYIPKLCIQLIVENAVIHGIEPKSGNGNITVNIYHKNERVFSDMEDDGVGFNNENGLVMLPLKQKPQDKGSNSVGLNNVSRIIQHFYGAEYGITIMTTRNIGTKVNIQIPIDHERSNYVQSDDRR